MRNILVLSLVAVAAASQATDLFTNHGLSTLSGPDDQVNVAGKGTFTAGPFDSSINGGPNFRTFCADLDHFTNAVPTAVSYVDTATMAAGYQKAAQLINKFGGTVGNDPLKNAALQGAIWASIYNTTAGDGTTGVGTQISTYLGTNLTGVSNHGIYFNLGTGNQSQIYAMPVPEPASIGAMAIGALGLLRRRKKA